MHSVNTHRLVKLQSKEFRGQRNTVQYINLVAEYDIKTVYIVLLYVQLIGKYFSLISETVHGKT